LWNQEVGRNWREFSLDTGVLTILQSRRAAFFQNGNPEGLFPKVRIFCSKNKNKHEEKVIWSLTEK
jgi:hypothetical protein